MMRFKRMPKQTYEFKDTTAPLGGESRKGRGRSNEDDGTAGSLSYSAASSMASNDSSFAEFRRVLDGDSKELASYLKQQQHVKKDEKSVTADSLAYSTDAETLHGRSDAESQLQGTSLVSSGHTGRSSSNNSTQHQYASALGESYLNNGGGQRPDLMNDNFISFEEEALKRRKERKRRDRVVPQPESRTPKSTSRPPQSPQRKQMVEEEDEEDVWYSKWWMFCFPDVMNPKR